MAYTYEQLSAMKVGQLREIAKGVEHEAVHGFLTMHKEKLVPALCKALGIDAHAHHAVIGVDKATIKLHIRELKAKRDAILKEKRTKELKPILRQIHDLKKELRKHTA